MPLSDIFQPDFKTTMHSNLLVKAEKFSPYILFDTDTKIFEIKGESTMEYPWLFYRLAIGWLTNFFEQNPHAQIKFEVFLLYFNTGTSCALIEIFDLLGKVTTEATIHWYAEPSDLSMLEEGEIFKEEFPDLSFSVQKRIFDPLLS